MAAEELAGRIGQTAEACEALGVSRSTLYRRRRPVDRQGGIDVEKARSEGEGRGSTDQGARARERPTLVNSCLELRESHLLPAAKPSNAPERVVKEVEAHCALLPPGFPAFSRNFHR